MICWANKGNVGNKMIGKKSLLVVGILIAATILLALIDVPEDVKAVPGELHVDDDGAQWPGAYTTIQAAINAANDTGDTIFIHEGIYRENGRESMCYSICYPIINAI